MFFYFVFDEIVNQIVHSSPKSVYLPQVGQEKGSGAFFTYPAGFILLSKGQFWLKTGDFGNPVRPETIEPRMVRRKRQHYPYMKMKEIDGGKRMSLKVPPFVKRP